MNQEIQFIGIRKLSIIIILCLLVVFSIGGLTALVIGAGEDIATDEAVKVITTERVIEVNETMKISISGTVYNITYIKESPKVITKCICDKKSGCTMLECLI
jgi:hypothetical protein